MKKKQTQFYCNNCGFESPKWLGKCPSCEQWNTFTEEVSTKSISSFDNHQYSWEKEVEGNLKDKEKVKTIAQIELTDEQKVVTTDTEFNRVLGGGITLGSIVLLAGEPGIGKSTILLQVALKNTDIKILYISGEESKSQIKLRADRIDKKQNQDNVFILTQTSTVVMFQEIKKIKPDCIIIDSIQTTYNPLIDSSPGSLVQIRECASEFIRYGKQTNTAIFIIGHVNKDGAIAGPKILEHMVDTVMQFEGDRYNSYRILRTLKNRFGSTMELGLYEMNIKGLTPITNPSQLFLNEHDEELSGTAVGVSMEGMRPLLMEIQALVSRSSYSTPQRTSTGVDIKRLQLLIAILEKKGHYALSDKDIFVNVVGGLKLGDTSTDLAIIAAIISSYDENPIWHDVCFVAEVGLNGEIRPSPKMEQRIKEAEKVGFKKIVISQRSTIPDILLKGNIEIIKISLISHLHSVVK